MTKLPRIVLACLAAACLSSMAAAAQAQPWIRDEMQGQAGMAFEKKLPCSVCHEHGNTGIGSVRTPFGLSVRMRGLIINPPDLATNVFDVVQKMKADHVDSDGDTVEDMDELKAYTDPNTPGPVPLIDRHEVGYGCQCDVAVGSRSTSRASILFTGIVASLALISVRRATRRGRLSRA